MANTNTPYIAKNAAPLVNPTTLSPFLQVVPPTPNANFVQQVAYVKYNGYASLGAGTSNNINNVRIAVRASGRATGGTTTNFQPSLLLGAVGKATPALPANFNAFASLTAAAFNSASGNWAIDASLLWDPNSGQINGSVGGFAGSGGTQTITATTAITPATGYTVIQPAANVTAAYSAGELQLFFAVGGVFSASNANNLAYLDQVEVEIL